MKYGNKYLYKCSNCRDTAYFYTQEEGRSCVCGGIWEELYKCPECGAKLDCGSIENADTGQEWAECQKCGFGFNHILY